MKKIELPPFARVMSGQGRLYFLFPTDGETNRFIGKLPEPIREQITLCENGFFMEIEKAPRKIFRVRQKMVLPKAFKYENLEGIKEKLFVKKWQETGFMRFENDVRGFKPFYLSFDNERMEWRLRQWGLNAMALKCYKWLDEAAIESVFKTCSDNAQEMPW